MLEGNVKEDYITSWNYVEGYFDEVYIDSGIKKLVIALNVIGIDTQFSCQGHYKGLSRTTAIGCIDNFGREYFEKIEDPPLEGCWNNPYVSFLLDIYPSLSNTEKERQQEEEKKQKFITCIQLLIDEYYQERDEILPEIRVRIRERITRYSNHEITASDIENLERVSETEDEDELEKKAMKRLRSAQEEIAGFSEFLRKKYLETGFQIQNHIKASP